MRLYLAGPMTGIPHFNYPAFNAAAAMLRAEGHEVFNPAEVTETDRRAALKADLTWICDHAEGIALLPGWERSSGARAEHALAVALGLTPRYLYEAVAA